jgi:hypothetical protein
MLRCTGSDAPGERLDMEERDRDPNPSKTGAA